MVTTNVFENSNSFALLQKIRMFVGIFNGVFDGIFPVAV